MWRVLYFIFGAIMFFAGVMPISYMAVFGEGDQSPLLLFGFVIIFAASYFVGYFLLFGRRKPK